MSHIRIVAFLLAIWSIGFANPLQAQVPDEMKEQAQAIVDIANEAYFIQGAAQLANEQYILATQMDPDNIQANYMAGITYLETVNRGRSAAYFVKVYEINPNYRFDILYKIGQGYQLNMEFEKALENFKAYKDKLLKDKNYRGQDKVSLSSVERRIFECRNAMEFIVNPANVDIINVGPAINSEWPDYGPVLNEDETMMVFTSRRREENRNEDVDKDNFPFEDVFIAMKENGEWQRAKNIGEVINTLYHDSNLGLSPDAKSIYLFGEDENGGGDIYVSDLLEDGTYTVPHPISENINSSFAEKSISVSPDGKTAFFSSDRPGGFGGIDIYMSLKDNRGNWGVSKNLGSVINTEYDDDGPFIDYDGKTLYFSSKGRKGMGGYDIFRSVYDEATDEWSEPVNLGFPINTPDNDIYFVSTKDGKRGYYASVREDGLGYNDIYMVNIPDEDEIEKLEELTKNETPTEDDPPVEDPPVTDPPKEDPPKENIAVTDPPKEDPPKPQVLQPVSLDIRVLDATSNSRIDATVRVQRTGSNTPTPASRQSEGIYQFNAKTDSPTAYTISVTKQGYLFAEQTVNLPASTTEGQSIKTTIALRQASANSRKVLRNIYFKFNSSQFAEGSYRELNQIEQFMADNPGKQVQIEGHTDNIGTAEYNKWLSQRRANAVKDYLVKKGVDARRITAVGYGEERPLASNDDEVNGRQLNRRVELKVLN